jgi:hypothetical protein
MTIGPAQEVLARTARGVVYQCGGGRVHVRVERQTLTFSPREPTQLVQLLGEAYVRLAFRGETAGVLPD